MKVICISPVCVASTYSVCCEGSSV